MASFKVGPCSMTLASTHRASALSEVRIESPTNERTITMKNSKTFAPILTAAALALAVPLAFAQDAQPPQQEAQAKTTQDMATQQAAPQAQPEQANAANWEDLDSDGNGTISKEEAAAAPRLAEIFEDVDANKDGELTADEYKAYLAANGAQPQKPTSEGG